MKRAINVSLRILHIYNERDEKYKVGHFDVVIHNKNRSTAIKLLFKSAVLYMVKVDMKALKDGSCSVSKSDRFNDESVFEEIAWASGLSSHIGPHHTGKLRGKGRFYMPYVLRFDTPEEKSVYMIEFGINIEVPIGVFGLRKRVIKHSDRVFMFADGKKQHQLGYREP